MQPFVSSDPRVEKRSSEIVALSVTSPHHPHSPAASSGNLQKMDQPLDHSALTMYWADPQREREGGGERGERERERGEKGEREREREARKGSHTVLSTDFHLDGVYSDSHRVVQHSCEWARAAST